MSTTTITPDAIPTFLGPALFYEKLEHAVMLGLSLPTHPAVRAEVESAKLNGLHRIEELCRHHLESQGEPAHAAAYLAHLFVQRCVDKHIGKCA